MLFSLTPFLFLLTTTTLAQQPNKVPGANPLTYCSANPASDIVKISDVEFLPNPPQKGQPLTIIANGTASQPIKKGDYIDLNVKWGWMSVLSERLDMCQQMHDNLKLECPSSRFSFQHEVMMPASMPRGTYYLKADARQVEGAELSCLGAEMHF